MPLTVLTDRDVNRVLHDFDRNDILRLQESMADALHWYSTSNDANDCCSDFQPERTHLQRKDGSTTLFMPSSGTSGQGIKVVSIVPPDASGLTEPTSAETRSSASLHSHSSVQSSTSDHSRQASVESSGTGQTSNTSASKGASTSTIRGSITVMDNSGNTIGLINAEEITAFRTALVSTLLLRKRHDVSDITVFGAGKQAYWHIRLALLLRGDEVRHLNVVTRNFETAKQCVIRLHNPFPDDPTFVNPLAQVKTKRNILTPGHVEYERLLKEYVRASNVIFTTVPSSRPLFPATYLTNPEGRKKGRYICAIGSYKPHLIEIHPDIIHYAVSPHHEHRHIHKRQKEGGAIVVDTIAGCMKEAGEVIQSKLKPDQLVELGELFMLKKEAERRHAAKGETTEKGGNMQDDSGLRDWLTKGNVIYKCVGHGLMDLVVSTELIKEARHRKIGVTIDDF